jgi:hypothetical protein
MRFACLSSASLNASAGHGLPSHYPASASIVLVCLSVYLNPEPRARSQSAPPAPSGSGPARGSELCEPLAARSSITPAGSILPQTCGGRITVRWRAYKAVSLWFRENRNMVCVNGVGSGRCASRAELRKAPCRGGGRRAPEVHVRQRAASRGDVIGYQKARRSLGQQEGRKGSGRGTVRGAVRRSTSVRGCRLGVLAPFERRSRTYRVQLIALLLIAP